MFFSESSVLSSAWVIFLLGNYFRGNRAVEVPLVIDLFSWFHSVYRYVCVFVYVDMRGRDIFTLSLDRYMIYTAYFESFWGCI